MNGKKFILIGHKKKQGKDTFGKMLKTCLGDAEILSFADPMREILAQHMGITVAEFKELYNGDEAERDRVKTFGNGKMIDYFGEQIWRDVLLKEADKLDCKYIIVPDFRFLREQIDGALTIKVNRPDVVNNDMHQSETELDNFQFDIIIHNNDSLYRLNNKAQAIANLIHFGNKKIEGFSRKQDLQKIIYRAEKEIKELELKNFTKDTLDTLPYSLGASRKEEMKELFKFKFNTKFNLNDVHMEELLKVEVEDQDYKNLLKDDEHEKNIEKVYQNGIKEVSLGMGKVVFNDESIYGEIFCRFR